MSRGFKQEDDDIRQVTADAKRESRLPYGKRPPWKGFFVADHFVDIDDEEPNEDYYI